MNELLQNPLFQSVILPFIVALIVAELFQRIKLSGLAVIAAFCSAIYFTNDFVFWPLTATRKLILVAIMAASVGLWLDLATKLKRPLEMLLAGLFAAAVTAWVLWPTLMQHPPEHRWQFAAGMVGYVVWVAVANIGFQDDSVRASASAWGLALGAGLAAWMGSSDLLGKFGVATAMAPAAYLFIQGVSGLRLPAGKVFVWPSAITAGLVAVTAVTLGKLSWLILPMLALIPLLVRMPFGKATSVRIQSLTAGFVAALPAAGAVFLIWYNAGTRLLG
jgi:hypothetical protein